MIHPKPNWRRRGITAAVAIATAMQFAPTAAGAVEVAAEDIGSSPVARAATDHDGEDRRFRLLRIAHRHGLDADALVELVRDRAGDEAADRLRDRLADRPVDRPADRPLDRPSDRPEPRPLPPEPEPTDRPTDERPDHQEREDVFAIGAIGKAHLAWTPHYVRLVEVKFAEGWKHRVEQETRQKLAIHFTDGESCGVFVAGIRPDGLHTDVHRTDCPDDRPDVRTETFPVGDIGKVTLAWTKEAIRVQDVATADGWKHRVHQEHRGKVLVAFTDGEHCVSFTAVLTEDGLRHDVTRRVCPTDRPDDRTTDGDRTSDEPTTDKPTTDADRTSDEPTTDADRTTDKPTTADSTTLRPVEANARRA